MNEEVRGREGKRCRGKELKEIRKTEGEREEGRRLKEWRRGERKRERRDNNWKTEEVA